MARRYRKESTAFRHVEILRRECGTWPGIVKREDERGVYWVTLYEPPIWEYQFEN